MKILVPTDFSDTAKNATRYAVEFAKYNKAKIVLFHFYDIPIPVTDIPVYIDTPYKQDVNCAYWWKVRRYQISRQKHYHLISPKKYKRK